MKLRILVSVLVVVGMLPMAAAQMAPANSPSSNDASVVAQTTETASGSASSASSNRNRNYTRLYVDSDDSHFELKPGESNEFTVTVKNHEDHEVELSPHLYRPPVGENLMEESWLDVPTGDTTLAAGEEREFTIGVSVPADAELGRYSGQIAFTDEQVTYPGRPPRPVHAEYVNVEVWKEPTVRILSGDYMHAQVEAGDSVTHKIVIQNTGDQAVPVNPELEGERERYRSRSSSIDRSWLDVDAPSEVAPGETATVSVTLSPAESADRGRYNAELDLGLKDPNRDERRNYWQRINLNFEVWKQPAQPFETTFDVSDRTDGVTLELKSQSNRYYRGSTTDSEPTSFDVQFVSPDGTVIDAERVQVSDTGFVDLSGERRTASTSKDYSVRGGEQTFVYRVDDPAAGAWTARIMPHNAIGFNYRIVRNETSA